MDDEPGETPNTKCSICEFKRTMLSQIRIKTSFYHRRP